MKKVLLSIFALAAYVSVNAQCNELFISQYVEGRGNDKAIQIYNPTNDSIGLNNLYRLIRYSNGQSEAAGNVTPNAPIGLGTHVIPPHGVWVIVLDRLTAPVLPVDGPIVDSLLQIQADTFLCPTYSVSYAMYFNGNDALSLQKTPDGGTTWNDVDIFAMIGDPNMVGLDGTGGWSPVFPYYASYESAWTYNHTLIRHPNVLGGVTVNPTQFIVSDQWDSLPVNTFDSLRVHPCKCPTNAGVNEIKNVVSVQGYPNPANNGYFTISSTEAILKAEIYNVLGEEMLLREGNKTTTKMVLETGNLPNGVYLVKAFFDKNQTTTIKLIVQ